MSGKKNLREYLIVSCIAQWMHCLAISIRPIMKRGLLDNIIQHIHLGYSQRNLPGDQPASKKYLWRGSSFELFQQLVTGCSHRLVPGFLDHFLFRTRTGQCSFSDGYEFLDSVKMQILSCFTRSLRPNTFPTEPRRPQTLAPA